MGTRVLLWLAAVLSICIAFFWWGEHRYNSGVTVGKAQIQVAWDADKLAIQKAADAAVATATKDKETAMANNEGVILDLQTQITSARGLNDQLSRSVREYQIRATAARSSVPQGHSGPAVTASAAPPSMGQFNDALGAALAECFTTRANYEALIKELQPQL